MLELKAKRDRFGPKILVIGVGGGGNNAVGRMMESHVQDVDFVAVNTDVRVLEDCPVVTKVQIGEHLTGGYGAGADPHVGEQAAMENEDDIRQLIENYDMVIITCGMGGGTGTGASPVIAGLAQEKNILVVGVVTLPFKFESEPRTLAAQEGVEKLKKKVDTLLVIPNDKLLKLSDKPLKLDEAFIMADSVLQYAIEGITNIVFNGGMVNLDFNDLRTILRGKGIGHLGVGIVGDGEPLMDAVKQAVNSPLLDTSIEGASNILLNTSGNVDIMSLNEAINSVREKAGKGVNLLWGTVGNKEEVDNRVVVTIIATGMPDSKYESQEKIPSPKDRYGRYFLKESQTIGDSFQVAVQSGVTEATGAPDYQKLNQTVTPEIKIPSFLANWNHNSADSEEPLPTC